MADFKTHLIGATGTTAVATTIVGFTTKIEPLEAVSFLAVGTVGGLLPDLDSETSIPLRMAQRVVTTVGTLLVVLAFADRYAIVELVLIAAVTFAGLTATFDLFGRMTSHRGLVHSLPATACFAAGTALAASQLGANNLEAWLYGVFVALGALSHLILDEMSSVNLLGASINKSFGSALSFGDRSNPLATTAVYGLAAILFGLAPSLDPLISLTTDPDTYQNIVDRIWPDGRWFA